MSIEPIALPAVLALQTWLVRLDDAGAQDGADVLDARERERAASFRFERDRRRFIAAHIALRAALARRTGRPAASLAFEAGEHGKPRLLGAPRCAFSLSHSGERALIVLADDGEIGTDLEQLRPLRDVDALARRCLGARELGDFEATPEAERDLAFLRAWTRKEACLKAIGTGLHVELATFEVGLDAARRTVCVETVKETLEIVVESFNPAQGFVGANARLANAPKRGC